MLNFKNKSSNNVIKKTSFALLLSIAGCGGGGGGSDTVENQASNTLVPVTPIVVKTIKAKVQAGTVEGSTVDLFSTESVLLYSAVTDSNGEYEIVINDFKEALATNGLNEYSPIVAKASFGTDIDPDDDGDINNDTDIIVNGNMRIFFPDGFNQIKDSITNPLTTKVINILLGVNNENLANLLDINGLLKTEETKEKIREILVSMGAKDINNDSILSIADINSYDMVIDNSLAEDKIRIDGTLDAIHSGIQEDLSQSLESVLLENNFVLLENKIIDEKCYIKLVISQLNSNIEYSLDGENWITYAEDIDLILLNGESIDFREIYVSLEKSTVKNFEYIDNSIDIYFKPVPTFNSFELDEDKTYKGKITADHYKGTELTYSNITTPINGNIDLNSDGSFEYTPNEDFYGDDSLIISVFDGKNSVNQEILITVHSSNDLTEVENSDFSTLEDTEFSGQINVTDIDSDEITLTLINDVQNGSLVFNKDGSYQYLPKEEYSGADKFTIKIDDGIDDFEHIVNINVIEVNDEPIISDPNFIIEEGDIYTGAINVSDIDSSDISIVLITTTENGELTLNEDGTYIYTPNPDFYGNDSFLVEVSDGTNTVEQLVEITINNVNDAPIIISSSFNVNEDITYNGQIEVVDIDSINISMEIITTTQNGELVFNDDGSYTYKPKDDFFGDDSFILDVSDGDAVTQKKINIIVKPINDEPTANNLSVTTTEDTIYTGDIDAQDIDSENINLELFVDVQNGELVLNADGTYEYKPEKNFFGEDSFTVKISDGDIEVEEIIKITVDPVNDIPVISEIEIIVTEDLEYTGIIEIIDIDSEDLDISLVKTTQNGVLDFNEDGTFSYIPTEDFYGDDSFIISVSDGEHSFEKLISMTIIDVADSPVVNTPSASFDQDTIFSGNLNITDVDSENFTIELITTTENGTLIINQDGTYTYTPNPGFYGEDSFKILLNDGSEFGLEHTIKITVNYVDTTFGIEVIDFNTDYPEIVQGPIGDPFFINWYNLGVSKNSNDLTITATIKSGVGDIITIDGHNLYYKPKAYSVTTSENIVLSLTYENGATNEFTITIDNIDTKNMYTKKLFCSPDIILNPEEDTYKEYWIDSNITKPTWLRSYVNADGCKYVNKKERWMPRIANVFGVDVPYQYYKYSQSTSDNSFYRNGGVITYEDHEFTGAQRYLRTDGIWVEYNLGSSKSDYGTATIRRYLESLDYFIELDKINKNIAPVFPEATFSTIEEQSFSGIFSATDENSDNLTYQLGEYNGDGSISVTSDGEFTYTPANDFIGFDTFQVGVSDQYTTTYQNIGMQVNVEPDKIIIIDTPAIIGESLGTETQTYDVLGDGEFETQEEEITFFTENGVIDQDVIDKLTEQRDKIQANIEQKNTQIGVSKQELNTLETQKNSQEISALDEYNNGLNVPEKVLIDNDITTTTKKSEIGNNLDGAAIAIEYKVQDSPLFLSTITSSTIESGESVTEEMVTTLETEIETEQNKLDNVQKEIDKINKDISNFQDENSDVITDYQNAVDNYDNLLDQFKDVDTSQSFGWNIYGVITNRSLDDAIREINFEFAKLVNPNQDGYTLTETNTKDHSRDFAFPGAYKLLGEIVGVSLKYGRIRVGKDYPAILQTVNIKEGNSTSTGTYGRELEVKNKVHKNALGNYLYKAEQKNILIEHLDELQGYDGEKILLGILITLLAELEGDLLEKVGEKNELKKIKEKLEDNIDGKKIKLAEYKTSISNFGLQLEAIDETDESIDDTQDDLDDLENEKGELEEDQADKQDDLDKAKEGVSIEITDIFATNSKDSVTIGNKSFSINISADISEKKSESELIDIINNRLDKLEDTYHVTNFDVKGETVILTNRVLYYLNGETKYPAYMWGEYSSFGLKRESQVFAIVESYEGEGDIIKEEIRGNLEKAANQVGTYDNFEPLLLSEEGNKWEYKAVVHYNYDNNGEEYPAKVGIRYKLGSHEYFIYSDELATDVDNKKTIAEGLIQNLRTNLKDQNHSAIKVNAGKTIWWNGEYVPMVGGAYNMYQVDSGYIATYKVANQGTWHTSTLWSNPDSLETELIRILDNWHVNNSTEPVIENDGRSEVEDMSVDPEIIDINYDKLINYFNEIENDYKTVCQNNAEESLPLTGSNSLLTNYQNQIDYIDSCIVTREKQQHAIEFANGLAHLGITYANNFLSTDPKIVGAHGKGFGKGTYDGAIGIINQPQDLIDLGYLTIKGTKDGLERFAHLMGLGILKGYDLIVESDKSQEIYDKGLENIASRGLVIKEEINEVVEQFKDITDRVSTLMTQLDLIKPEQAAYYKGYLEGYSATLVGEAVALTYLTKKAKTTRHIITKSKSYTKFILILNNLEYKLELAKEIKKINSNKVNFDLVDQMQGNFDKGISLGTYAEVEYISNRSTRELEVVSLIVHGLKSQNGGPIDFKVAVQIADQNATKSYIENPLKYSQNLNNHGKHFFNGGNKSTGNNILDIMHLKIASSEINSALGYKLRKDSKWTNIYLDEVTEALNQGFISKVKLGNISSRKKIADIASIEEFNSKDIFSQNINFSEINKAKDIIRTFNSDYFGSKGIELFTRKQIQEKSINEIQTQIIDKLIPGYNSNLTTITNNFGGNGVWIDSRIKDANSLKEKMQKTHEGVYKYDKISDITDYYGYTIAVENGSDLTKTLQKIIDHYGEAKILEKSNKYIDPVKYDIGSENLSQGTGIHLLVKGVADELIEIQLTTKRTYAISKSEHDTAFKGLTNLVTKLEMKEIQSQLFYSRVKDMSEISNDIGSDIIYKELLD